MSSSSIEGFDMTWWVLIFLKTILFFQASDSHSYEEPAVLQNFLEIYRRNPSFEMATIKGSHHLHLNTPERVLPPLLNFIKTLENINQIEWLRNWGTILGTINCQLLMQCHEKLIKLNWSIISTDIVIWMKTLNLFYCPGHKMCFYKPQTRSL